MFVFSEDESGEGHSVMFSDGTTARVRNQFHTLHPAESGIRDLTHENAVLTRNRGSGTPVRTGSGQVKHSVRVSTPVRYAWQCARKTHWASSITATNSVGRTLAGRGAGGWLRQPLSSAASVARSIGLARALGGAVGTVRPARTGEAVQA